MAHSAEYYREWRKRNPESSRRASRKHYRANREKILVVARKNSNAKYHSLTPAQKRERGWKGQKFPEPTRPMPEWCEGCGRVPEKVLCLDHDHSTGKFRGWLCQYCNRGLGFLGDDLASVERIHAYLKRAI